MNAVVGPGSAGRHGLAGEPNHSLAGGLAGRAGGQTAIPHPTTACNMAAQLSISFQLRLCPVRARGLGSNSIHPQLKTISLSYGSISFVCQLFSRSSPKVEKSCKGLIFVFIHTYLSFNCELNKFPLLQLHLNGSCLQ